MIYSFAVKTKSHTIMKKFLLAILLIGGFYTARAQCNELFISEYVEGSNNNKAIELYNPTNAAINFNNNYRLVRWDNGSTTADQNAAKYVNLGVNTIPAYGTFVIVLDKRDPTKTGIDTMVNPALQAKADTFLNPVYATNNTMYFNGDDAMSLQKYNGASWSDIDIFGLIGERPLNGNGTTSPVGGWTATPNYHDGQGTYWSRDHSLIRKSTITQGVSVNPGIAYNIPGDFNPSVQWDSLPVNTFTSLGSHNSSCNPPTSIKQIESGNSIKLFPNPVIAQQVSITSGRGIEKVEIFNTLGQAVFTNKINSLNEVTVNTKDFPAGIYLVGVTTEINGLSYFKIIIQ